MKLAYPLFRVALFALFMAVISRPMTGCTKNPFLPDKVDSTDTVFHPKQYDSAAFYVSILINIYNTSGVFNDTFADDASLHVYVVNGVVTFDSILNFPPTVFPSSGTNGIYNAKWIPDDIGLINITSAYGLVDNVDTAVVVALTHTGTVTPNWQLTAIQGGTTTYSGNNPTPGWPPGFTFKTNLQSQDAFRLDQPGSYWDVWVYKDY